MRWFRVIGSLLSLVSLLAPMVTLAANNCWCADPNSTSGACLLVQDVVPTQDDCNNRCRAQQSISRHYDATGDYSRSVGTKPACGNICWCKLAAASDNPTGCRAFSLSDQIIAGKNIPMVSGDECTALCRAKGGTVGGFEDALNAQRNPETCGYVPQTGTPSGSATTNDASASPASGATAPPVGSADFGAECRDVDPLFPVRLGVAIGGVDAVNGLTEYVNVVYRYLTAIVLVVTIVMITYGGFRYLLSATALGVSDGKDIIKNGIIGMVLVLSSYVILNTINPATTVLQLTRPPENIRCEAFRASLQAQTAQGNDQCTEDSQCPSGQKCVVTTVVAQNLSNEELLAYGGLGAGAGAYVGGPIGGAVGGVGAIIYSTADRVHKCTDGRAGSPCGSTEDCASGFLCMDDWQVCMPPSGIPRGSPCDTSYSNICESGTTCQVTDHESLTEDWAVCRGEAQPLTWSAIRSNNYRVPDALRCFIDADCTQGYVCKGPAGAGKKYCVLGSTTINNESITRDTISVDRENPTPCFQTQTIITPTICAGSVDQSLACVVCASDNKWQRLNSTTDPNRSRIGACADSSMVGTNCR